jgi:S-adenosylmethionine-diacylglycerol 3-amino-3-carboxypropyl transferase
MSIFFSRLSYSFGNEDWRTEQKALKIQPDSHVLCITASGDRPLHLLLDNPQKIVSVDANPVQNHLLKLKLAALKKLDTQACLGFLGVTDSHRREATLQALTDHLDEETAEYWEDNRALIRSGIIYQGATERWARKGSWFLRLVRRREIRRLYEMKTLEEQRAFLRHEWNHTLWRNAFRYTVNRWFSRLLVKDPGLYSNVDAELQPGLYLYDRMMACLDKQLARENPLISLVLRGHVNDEALPPYLTQEGMVTLKPKVDRIQTQTANIITYMESVPEKSFDRFSLSDIASYMDQPDFLRLLKAMFRAAKPNARFCMRQFMSRYKIPEGLKPYFQTEPELEKELEANDGAFVYHFTVGKVLKD